MDCTLGYTLALVVLGLSLVGLVISFLSLGIALLIGRRINRELAALRDWEDISAL